MPEATRCLVVGLPAASLAGDTLSPEEVASITFGELGAISPWPDRVELVLAPLFCADFDAMEIMELLAQKGFRRALRIVAPKLPNRQIVLRELRSHATRQGLTLELVELG